MHNAKILSLDIETAPLKGYAWGLWQQNIGLNQIESDWYMLTWAAKWLGSDEMLSDSSYNYSNYEAGDENDYNICYSMWLLLDEADIVIGHNGKKFDIPKLNARFLKHGFEPPSPYKIIDTLNIARSMFKLTSNKLQYLAEYLGVGFKMDPGGFPTWVGCMKGDAAAWDHMLRYNEMDVQVLEDVYLELRPWDKQHPNVTLYDTDETLRCPKCGSEDVHEDGEHPTPVNKYPRYKCGGCGGWLRGATMLASHTKGKRQSMLRNAI